MKKQMSQLGMGICMALLLLGFSHKGTHGEIPVNPEKLSEKLSRTLHARDRVKLPAKNAIHSLFVRPHGRGSRALLMLVAYDEHVHDAVRRIAQSEHTPLIFSVSTLPETTVLFEPRALIFEQEGRAWQPTDDEFAATVIPLGVEARFGGELIDSEIHQGVILLPAWFDIERPLTVRYNGYSRTVSF